jgi:hypothetical protein
MSSFNTSIDEEYTIRRIEGWFIKFENNRIYGTIQPANLSIDTYVNGYIVSWVDNRVLAKINCKLYALVLGKVNECYADKKCLYKAYLKTKVSAPTIVL